MLYKKKTMPTTVFILLFCDFKCRFSVAGFKLLFNTRVTYLEINEYTFDSLMFRIEEIARS